MLKRSNLSKFKLQYLWIIYICLILTVTILFLPSYSIQLQFYGRVTDQTNLLRVQNISHYVKPHLDTYFTDVPENFLSYAKALNGFRSLTVFICSDVKHRDRRRNIRSTWGRVLRPKPIFLLGIGNNETDNVNALEEARLYRDVIIEDFKESYQNLTLKTIFALKHFLRLTPNAKYFLKIDDDVFLNVFRLDFIMEKYQDTPGIIGHLESQKYAHRDKESKWFTPRWMFYKERLPTFINGPAYLISGSLVKTIYDTALKTPLITLEDVFLTGLVSNDILKIPLYHNGGFEDFYSINLLLNKNCFYRSVFTIHRMTDMKQIFNLWRNLKLNHTPCWDI